MPYAKHGRKSDGERYVVCVCGHEQPHALELPNVVRFGGSIPPGFRVQCEECGRNLELRDYGDVFEVKR